MTSAGVFHAYVKNRQIHVQREIRKTEQRIVQHELEIQTLQMRLGEQLNRYLIRDRLREIASDLRPIPAGDLEVIDALQPERTSPGLAHRSSPPNSTAVASGP